jgi:membrane protein YdbS with pleckstrin-like domain
MERQMLRDDPEFCARMTAGTPETPRRRRRLPMSLILTALVAWISALVLGILGWWLAAAVAALCATALVYAVIHYVIYRRTTAT